LHLRTEIPLLVTLNEIQKQGQVCTPNTLAIDFRDHTLAVRNMVHQYYILMMEASKLEIIEWARRMVGSPFAVTVEK
jgi:hypothetical protein